MTIQVKPYGQLGQWVVELDPRTGADAPLLRTTAFADGTSVTMAVAGADMVTAASGGQWVDADAPLGPKATQITWTWGPETTAVTPDGLATSVLSDPFRGMALAVTGVSIGDKSRESATAATWLSVEVHGTPLIHARPEQAYTQTMTLRTATRADRELLDALCSTRAPLLLRTPTMGVDDMWFTLAGVRTQRRLHDQLVSLEWRLHEWKAITVTRPTPPHAVHAASTLGGVDTYTRELLDGSTLGDIATHWPSLGKIGADELLLQAGGWRP